MRDLVRLPKAHLHTHLETSVRAATLEEIARGHGLGVPPSVRDRPPTETFSAFVERQTFVRSCLRTEDDFRRVARELCEDEAAQGVAYVEVTFSAVSHGERLHRLEMPLVAVLEGLAEGGRAYGVESRVIIDHSRRRSVDRLWRAFDLAARYRRDGVVALGLAGDESYPLDPFREVLDAAAGEIDLVHHAGEHGRAADVAEVITAGHARRVGHGIRAVDDPDVVALVVEQDVTLEVCPTSNVRLGAVPSLATHPLPQMVAAGLPVTISTDGEIGLADELARVRDAFGLTDEIIGTFARRAVDASFAPAATKERLRDATEAWLAAADHAAEADETRAALASAADRAEGGTS